MPAEVKIYECEVKKLFKKDGVNEWRWVVGPVKDAISDGVTEFRCKDWHGAVKLLRPCCVLTLCFGIDSVNRYQTIVPFLNNKYLLRFYS